MYRSSTRGPEDDSVESKHVAPLLHYMFNLTTDVFDGTSPIFYTTLVPSTRGPYHIFFFPTDNSIRTKVDFYFLSKYLKFEHTINISDLTINLI